MEAINNAETNNVPKVNYDDKKYDVFFSHMVSDINPNYLDSQGRIKLQANRYGDAPFKSFSIQVADCDNKKPQDRKIYTKPYGCYFGYEFDINDRSFYVKFGAYDDIYSTPQTTEDVKKASEAIGKGERYTKFKTNNGLVDAYISNEEFDKAHGTDLRDTLVPKMIARLETVKEEVNAGKTLDDEQLTNNMYEKHHKNNAFDSSFTRENYKDFVFNFDNDSLEYSFELKSMLLCVKNKDVFFYSHNEVGAASKDEDIIWVLPKRLIFSLKTLNCRNEEDINKFMVEFCEANKKYKSDIRIIDDKKRTTQVVSPRQFKDILVSHKDYYNKLTQQTIQKLDEMIEIYEQKNNASHNSVNRQTNNNLYDNQQKALNNDDINKTDLADCECCNIF